MLGLKKLRRWLLYAAGVFIFVLLVVLLIPIPDIATHPPLARAIYSRQGELLDVQIADDNQWRMSLQGGLPDKYLQSLLLFEDKRYYTHPGINLLAMARALRDNLRAGHIVSGASTITMQLARILRGHRERTYANKLMEVLLALKLELFYNKHEILQLYALHAPMGRNIVGLTAASWHYFNRPPGDLSWAEAALLAVLPNRPSMLYLDKNREALKQRRDELLHQLQRAGYLDIRSLDLAVAETLPPGQHPWPSVVPHLLDRLAKTYPGQDGFHSTIDKDLQQNLIERLVNHHRTLSLEGVRNISVVVIDHQILETLAYVGNYTDDGRSRDVDIAASPRSTASVIKPLLFASMIDSSELVPGMLIPDVPTTIGKFAPENHDHKFHGAVPASQMLSQSLNVPAVYLLRHYGVERFRQQLSKYGLSTVTRSADDYGLTLVLGGAEANLWELTSVYARMAHLVESNPVDNTVANATLLADSPLPHTKTTFPVSPGAAWLTLQAMVEVTRPGIDSNWREFDTSQVIAWKTGTSFGFRDAWAIGSNGRYTVGVWVGNADGSPAPGLGGARSAGPVLMDVFSLLGKSEWLKEPAGALKPVDVCVDDGLLSSGNCKTHTVKIPVGSHFAMVSQKHQRIFLTQDGKFRVHNGCERVANMQAVDWFVLPPAQEYFWRREHSEYRSMPPWRKDCVGSLQQFTSEQPIDLLYPDSENVMYLPLDLDGKLGGAVFRAVHRDNDAVLYWHVDGEYLGETHTFHEKKIRAMPGRHQLVLEDKNGQRLERVFKILGGDADPAPGSPVDARVLH